MQAGLNPDSEDDAVQMGNVTQRARTASLPRMRYKVERLMPS
jgi:hypothetical protein